MKIFKDLSEPVFVSTCSLTAHYFESERRRGVARNQNKHLVRLARRGVTPHSSGAAWRGAARPNGVEPLPGAERRDVQLSVMRRGAARRVLVSLRSGVARRGAARSIPVMAGGRMAGGRKKKKLPTLVDHGRRPQKIYGFVGESRGVKAFFDEENCRVSNC